MTSFCSEEEEEEEEEEESGGGRTRKRKKKKHVSTNLEFLCNLYKVQNTVHTHDDNTK